MNEVIICIASRGRYSEPIAYTKKPLNWVNEDLNFPEPIKPPLKFCCEDSRHFDNLQIAKNKGETKLHGNTESFPLNEMFIQRWVLTEKETQEAIRDYDMFSLEMQPKIICKFCAKKHNKRL